jgi:hypothetical protein
VGDAVGEGELSALFDADLAGGDACVFEGFGEEGVGAVVLIPGVDLGDRGLRECGGLGFHTLADAAFFEDRADDEGAAFDRENPGKEALGLSPGEAGEVVERGAGADDEGVDLILGEEFAGALDAVFALFEGDGDGFGAAAGEGGEGGRELDVGGWGGGALGLEVERRGYGCCRGG